MILNDFHIYKNYYTMLAKTWFREWRSIY